VNFGLFAFCASGLLTTMTEVNEWAADLLSAIPSPDFAIGATWLIRQLISSDRIPSSPSPTHVENRS
jgi:hypothetical protein